MVGGFKGLSAHADLWERLWGQLLSLGDGDKKQWVLSHVGMDGNKEVDSPEL